jgi:hypothetical protein
MGAIDAFLDDLLVLVFEHMPDAGPMEDAPAALCPTLTVSKRWHVRTLPQILHQWSPLTSCM